LKRCETENRCVPQRWRCDGSKDCADGSDERDCPTNQGVTNALSLPFLTLKMNIKFQILFLLLLLYLECGDGQFRCADGLSCIPLRRVCDGSNHCRDNSDESNCTSVGPLFNILEIIKHHLFVDSLKMKPFNLFLQLQFAKMTISNVVRTASVFLVNGRQMIKILINLQQLWLIESLQLLFFSGSVTIIGTARMDQTKRIAPLKLNVS